QLEQARARRALRAARADDEPRELTLGNAVVHAELLLLHQPAAILGHLTPFVAVLPGRIGPTLDALRRKTGELNAERAHGADAGTCISAHDTVGWLLRCMTEEAA